MVQTLNHLRLLEIPDFYSVRDECEVGRDVGNFDIEENLPTQWTGQGTINYIQAIIAYSMAARDDQWSAFGAAECVKTDRTLEGSRHIIVLNKS
jgi:hypothetical protein